MSSPVTKRCEAPPASGDASVILGGAPEAQGRGKKLMLDIIGRPLDDKLIQLTVEQIAEARASDEGKEGLSAFLNKQEPSWRKKA